MTDHRNEMMDDTIFPKTIVLTNNPKRFRTWFFAKADNSAHEQVEYIRAALQSTHKPQLPDNIQTFDQFKMRMKLALKSFLAKSRYEKVEDAQKAIVDYIIGYVGIGDPTHVPVPVDTIAVPDDVAEIENRWKDRFAELDVPAPSGTKRAGYVVDIYNLIKYIRTASTPPVCEERVTPEMTGDDCEEYNKPVDTIVDCGGDYCCSCCSGKCEHVLAHKKKMAVPVDTINIKREVLLGVIDVLNNGLGDCGCASIGLCHGACRITLEDAANKARASLDAVLAAEGE